MKLNQEGETSSLSVPKNRNRIYFFSYKSSRTSVSLVPKPSPIRTGGTPVLPVVDVSISVFGL